MDTLDICLQLPLEDIQPRICHLEILNQVKELLFFILVLFYPCWLSDSLDPKAWLWRWTIWGYLVPMVVMADDVPISCHHGVDIFISRLQPWS